MEMRMQTYLILICYHDTGIFLRSSLYVLKQMYEHFRNKTDNSDFKNLCLQAMFSDLQNAISNVVIWKYHHIGRFSYYKIGLDSKF